jgi:hypothetical protein
MWCRDLYIRALISKDITKQEQNQNQYKNKIKQTNQTRNQNKRPKTNGTEVGLLAGVRSCSRAGLVLRAS